MTPVFYDKRMNVNTLFSFSPSAGKPTRFMHHLSLRDWRSYGPHATGGVEPVTKKDLYRVHDKDYVDGVFALRIPNGFENVNPLVPESCLWTIGSLMTAARYAMQYPETPVCSPTSGFHHAHYSHGGGYCTFNGLMVVASKIISEGKKVAILDLDMHYGDGTADIIKRFPDLEKKIVHRTSGASFFGDDEDESFTFMTWLEKAVADINDFNPDLVIYQAGADPHIDDPLGGFLDDEGLKERDRYVFCNVRAPIVWNLAGGYQKTRQGEDPVLNIHFNTITESNRSVIVRERFIGAQHV